MKKHSKIFSMFISVLILCMALSPVSAMAATSANEGENYTDI